MIFAPSYIPSLTKVIILWWYLRTKSRKGRLFLSFNLCLSLQNLFYFQEEVASLPISFSVKTAVAASKSSGRLFPSPSKGASYFIQCALNSSVQIANRVVLIRWNLTDSSHLEKVVRNISLFTVLSFENQLPLTLDLLLWIEIPNWGKIWAPLHAQCIHISSKILQSIIIQLACVLLIYNWRVLFVCVTWHQ